MVLAYNAVVTAFKAMTSFLFAACVCSSPMSEFWLNSGSGIKVDYYRSSLSHPLCAVPCQLSLALN
jgi:hypothetical protein